LAVPIIEIALFIQVGSAIGTPLTLLVVVLTAIIGTWLMRMQGFSAINRIRTSINTMSDPTEPLADGAMILFAGALLLTPGFFTDALGFLLLFAPFRAVVFRYVRSKITVAGFTNSPTPHDDGVIDADYTEIPPSDPKNNGPSGWTQH
jgi:UPF0716 protein FxsA